MAFGGMAKEKVMARARKRWGAKAHAAPGHLYGKKECWVGYRAEGGRFEVKGRGPTWKEAFRMADHFENPDPEQLRLGKEINGKWLKAHVGKTGVQVKDRQGEGTVRQLERRAKIDLAKEMIQGGKGRHETIEAIMAKFEGGTYNSISSSIIQAARKELGLSGAGKVKRK